MSLTTNASYVIDSLQIPGSEARLIVRVGLSTPQLHDPTHNQTGTKSSPSKGRVPPADAPICPLQDSTPTSVVYGPHPYHLPLGDAEILLMAKGCYVHFHDLLFKMGRPWKERKDSYGHIQRSWS